MSRSFNVKHGQGLMGRHLWVKFDQPELKSFQVLNDDMQNWVNH